MSYSAGHILIMPKNNWNNVTTYKILDAVRHDGKAYLSKINGNTNHTPSGSTDNYWFLFAEDGFTPSVTASKTGKDTTITYTNRSGSSTSHVYDGEDGTDGVSVTNITKTGSQTVDGRVVDTYTVNYSNSTTSTFQVVNGKDGTGVGDMEKSVYDKDNNGIVDGVLGNTELIKDTVGFTSKNLIPFPYDAQSKTSQGITYTINNDGSITLNGTSTSDGGFNLWEDYGLKLKPGDYILSSGVNMPTNSYFTLQVSTTNYNVTNNNSSISFSLNSESEIRNYRIYIKSGVTFNNVTVYPMLRKADIMDSTYEQYHAPMSSYVDKRLRDALGATGKNLLPFPYQDYNNGSYTSGGITFTIDSNGIITANGTATATVWFNIYTWNKASFNVGERYILSGCPSGGGESYRIVFRPVQSNGNEFDWINNTGGEDEFIISSTIYNYANVNRFICKIRIGSGTTVTNLKFYPMLRSADILDGEYEPYGNIQDYTDNALKRTLGNTGKNLIPYPYYSGTKTTNGVSFIMNSDGSVTVNGTATADTYYDIHSRIQDNFLPKGQYIITSGVNGTSNSTYEVYLHKRNADNTNWSTKYPDWSNEGLVTIDSNVTYAVSIRVCNGQTLNNITFYPMIRKASIKSSDYEPYYTGALSEQANNILGAKNLWKYPYTKTTQTLRGVTFTDNGDGSITVNGTNSSTDYAGFNTWSNFTAKELGLPKGKYILSGGKKNFDIDVTVYNKTTGVRYVTGGSSRPEEVEFEVTNYTDLWEFYIGVSQSKTANNVTIYPMIRLADIQDDTWTPYAMTNNELTKNVATELLASYSWSINTIGLEYGDNFKNKISENSFKVAKFGRIIEVTCDSKFTEAIETGSWDSGILVKNLPWPHAKSGLIGLVGSIGNGDSFLLVQVNVRNNIAQLEFVKNYTIPAETRIKIHFTYICD